MDVEKALYDFLDGEECERAQDNFYEVLRKAFLAGIQYGRTQSKVRIIVLVLKE